MGEQRFCKAKVRGSNPRFSTKGVVMFYVWLLPEDSPWRRFIYQGVFYEQDCYTRGTRVWVLSTDDVQRVLGNPHDLMESGTIRRATEVELLTGTYLGDTYSAEPINRAEVTFV